MSVYASFLILSLVSLSAAQRRTFCGYRTQTDVRQHAMLDLDQEAMESRNDAFRFSAANNIYSNGGNSRRSSGFRTLRGFSTTARSNLRCEPFYEFYRAFYNSATYADDFVRAALRGRGMFSRSSRVFRSECATKGSQYQNVWMYVIHEMEDAINDCFRGDLMDNDGGVAAWDEAAAFYCGSIPGPRGNRRGVMLHSLAQARCDNFRTCRRGRRGEARVNRSIRSLLNRGRRQLNRRQCRNAIATKNSIARNMVIPLVQGVLRYVILTNPDEPNSQQHAEGWAFLRACLPLIRRCNAGSANLLVSNFQPRNRRPMGDGVRRVANAMYRVLGCLGIRCRDIGTVRGLPRCRTSGSFRPIPNSGRASCRICRTC